MALYHRELGFPRDVDVPSAPFELTYGWHARRAADDDRFGPVGQLPDYLNPASAWLIELEVRDGIAFKAVYRLPVWAEDAHGNGLDLCLAVLLHNGFVKTVWQNRTDDDHRSLRAWLYARP